MSTHGEYTIISNEDEIMQIRENLEISLNIIFFHRYLGNNNYEDVQSNINKISYVKLKNEKLSKENDNIINEIENNFKNNNKDFGQQLTLSFYDKNENKKELKNPWEIWNFILILSKNEDLKNKEDLNDKKEISNDDRENKMKKYNFNIIEKLNDKDDYMPNVIIDDKSLNEETFPFDLKINKILTKENYLSIFDHFVKKDKSNIIVINNFP